MKRLLRRIRANMAREKVEPPRCSLCGGYGTSPYECTGECYNYDDYSIRSSLNFHVYMWSKEKDKEDE